MKRPVPSSNTFWSAFVTAWNAHSAPRVAAHFTEDACLEFYDGKVYTARNAIEIFYRDVFAQMPAAWLHSDPIADGTGTDTTGTFSITHTGRPVIALHYDLALNPAGLIQHFILTKI